MEQVMWLVGLELEVVQSDHKSKQSTPRVGQSTEDQQKRRHVWDHQVFEPQAQMPSEALCWQLPSCSKLCLFSRCSFEVLPRRHHRHLEAG